MFKFKFKTESGRTLLETLAVVAIVGILSVASAWLYSYLINRHETQILLEEAMRNHVRFGLEWDGTATEWHAPYSPTKTNYRIQFRYDILGNDFMKVEGVEREICEILLRQAGSFTLLTLDNQPLTVCERTNTIILGFLKDTEMISCHSDAECENGRCSDGQCVSCAAGEYYEAGECHTACTRNADCGNDSRIHVCQDGRCIHCNENERWNAGRGMCDRGYQPENGNYRFCSEYGAPSGISAADCAQCDDTDFPRELQSNWAGTLVCVLKTCPPGTGRSFRGRHCIRPKEGYLFYENGDGQVACSTNGGVGLAREGWGGKAPIIEADMRQVCALCDNTDYPRYLKGNGCYRVSCDPGYFHNSDGECISCTRQAWVSDAAECTKCTESGYPHIMGSNGYCHLCSDPADYEVDSAEACAVCNNTDYPHFMGSNGRCYICSATHSPDATAAECAQCDNSATPRQMMNGKCGNTRCEAGRFLLSDGGCRLCSDGGSPDASAAECAKCDTTDTPRFYATNGQCRLCSNDDSVDASAAECAKCDTTDTPRKMFDNRCGLITCRAGMFQKSNGDCRLCSNGGSVEASAAECAKCDTTDTPREMVGHWCVKESSTCETNQFLGENPASNALNCRDCSDNLAYITTADRCSSGCPTTRHMQGDLCVKNTCEDGYIRNANGTCVSCSEKNIIPYDATECDTRCPGRVMLNGACLAACTSGQYRLADGSCRSCSTGGSAVPYSEEICLSCNNTSVYPHYFENGQCYSTGCERLYFKNNSNKCVLCADMTRNKPYDAQACVFCDAFLASDGYCKRCAVNEAVSTTASNCAMCDDTDFPREMSGDKCIPVCDVSTQIRCSNATNTWCCPNTAGCGSGENEASKCLASSEGQCSYRLSQSAVGYTVIMEDECNNTQYCFGKWNSDGTIVRGWSETLYGVCLDMTDSVDSEAKDALNPWKSD